MHLIPEDCEDHARQWLDEVYEKEHRKLEEEYVQKDWEYQTNINDETSAAAVSVILQYYKVFVHLHWCSKESLWVLFYDAKMPTSDGYSTI